MEKYKKILSFWPFVLSICAAIYLTYMVDLITLDTVFQKVFVFLFLASFISILFFIFKKCVGFDLDLKLIVCAILLSLSVVILSWQGILPTKKQSTITFEAVVEENVGHGQEVWLAEVELDGKTVSVAELEVLSNEGWKYISDLDDYVYYPVSSNSNENSNKLTVQVFGENIKIVFARNSWSGKVSCTLNNSDQYETLQLYSGEDNSVKAEVLSLNLSANNSPWTLVLSSVGAIITVFLFVYMLLVTLKRNIAKRKKQTAFSQNFTLNTVVFSIYLFLVTVLIEMFEKTYACSFQATTIGLVFIVLLLFYPYAFRILPMFKKLKIAEIVLLFVVIFIITFQIIAEIVFMQFDKTTVNFIDLLTFAIAMAVFTVPVLEIVLFIDNRTENRFAGGEKIEKE